MSKLRLFYALDLPGEANARLEEEQRALGPRLRNARWIGGQAFHVTLKFLGPVESERLPSLVQALEDAARGIPPLRVHLGEVGAFSAPRRAHVLVVHLVEEGGQLARLHRGVEGAAAELGFPREDRAFRPHVTLARFKPPADVRTALSGRALPADPFLIDRVVLYRSQLSPSGSRYEALATVTLSAAPAGG